MRLAHDHDHQFGDWGYATMPSRVCPINFTFMEWIYVIDLELNVFRISTYDNDTPLEPGRYRTQYFRLDNIPRDLFEPEAVAATGLTYLIMSGIVAAEHSVDCLSEIPAPDPVLLELYQSFSPAPTPSFALPSGDRKSHWCKLQLGLLGEFVKYFVYSFRDSCPWGGKGGTEMLPGTTKLANITGT
ncbi:hypothetical protein Q9L58_006090 [Maublancomyces gigas]|uniref:Uncharacterized protein n=1 Tax=Discina gigas TaxID=1032678 RepID=A0ABR3GG78_9PEZI